MDITTFWAIIHETRAVSADNDEMIDGVRIRLEGLSPDEIAAYQNLFDDCMQQLYRWDVWGAAYTMNGGCSDDGFEYWRAMLISQGKEAFETALRDPDSLADLEFDEEASEGEWDFEDMLHLANEVYQQKAGKELNGSRSEAGDPVGEAWNEETVYDRFPKIKQRFG